jgi:hypothetical protein
MICMKVVVSYSSSVTVMYRQTIRRLGRARYLAMLFAVGACSNPPASTETFRKFVALIAAGSVSDSSGVRVSGAMVRLTPLSLDFPGNDTVGTCVGAAVYSPTTVQTDARGSFRALISVGPAHLACVTAQVTPPSGSGLAGAVVSVGHVEFRDAYNIAALDTARFAIILARH